MKTEITDNGIEARVTRDPKKLRINWVMARANMSGGSKSNRLIAEAMVRCGHEINMIFNSRHRPWPSPLRVRRFTNRLFSEVRLLGKQKHHLDHAVTNLIPVDSEQICAAQVPDADVCIASWWQMREAIQDWPASKGLKAYFVRGYELHGGDSERVKATYRMPGIKLVISTWLQRLMAEEFDDPNAILVPNGVDWSQFDSTPRPKASTPTVGFLYGISSWKGAGTALEAMQIVQRRCVGVRVICFGSSGLKSIHKRMRPKNFEFYLRPPQHDIPELYRAADCWLVPSTTEGFGMPGLEAAACRCPVVATRCGGPEDYVQDGVSGYLVDVGDAEAMADRIVQVLRMNEEAWRSMSEASYAIARRFDWDRSAEKLEKVLLDARTGQRKPSSSM